MGPLAAGGRRRIAQSAAIWLAVGLLGGCSGTAAGSLSGSPDVPVPNPSASGQADSSSPDLAALQAEPATALAMPVAEQLGQLAQERTRTPDGDMPAFAGGIWGTQSSAEEVRAFYDGEL